MDLAGLPQKLRNFYSGLASIISIEPVGKGSGNTNLAVKTAAGPYFMKIIPPLQYKHLPRQEKFYANIERAGLQTIAPLKNNMGQVVTEIDGQKILVFPFETLTEPAVNPAMAEAMGELVAKLHITQISEAELAPAWDSRERCLGLLEQLDEPTRAKYEKYRAYIEEVHDLPEGFVFHDVCPDNLYAKDGQLLGFIDPEHAGYGEFIFDIAGAMIMSYFGRDDTFELCCRFLQGYTKHRTLTAEEGAKLFPALIYMCVRLSLFFELKAPPKNTERITLRLGFADNLLKMGKPAFDKTLADIAAANGLKALWPA
ncbi:MAG TPA: phosphotransferase [Candidatus Saccharimonadia bacterium]|jgi:Ser/Thr protein kinase RdoA (MazF antagonist)|nr:phosphotransferase [Candidatus Saccharimonadia bacterium]